MAKIHCSECGGEIRDTDNFCTHCGNKVSKERKSFEIDEDAFRKGLADAQKKKRDRRTKIALVVIAVIAFMAWLPGEEKKDEVVQASSEQEPAQDTGEEGSILASMAEPEAAKEEPKAAEGQEDQKSSMLEEEWSGPFSESEAMMYCQKEAKGRARNPSTVDFAWFSGADYARDAQDNLITSIRFTAKNDFNAEQSYIALCAFTKQGDMTISISRI